MVKRNLRHIPRSPELLLDVTVQPVIFVVLFVYIFGGAIQTPGMSYVNYLMAGIFVQTLIFACMTSGIGLAYDLQKGLDRPLPLAPDVSLGGRRRTDDHRLAPRHAGGGDHVRRRRGGRLPAGGHRARLG